jgi:quercetin dioxygenase-like cupin family protein
MSNRKIAIGTQQPFIAVLVSGEETGGRFPLIETVEQRGAELPAHRHHWEDETLYVLEGALAVSIAGTWVHASAGSAVFVPRGAEHVYAVTSDAARVLTMLTPAGFERFYQERDAAPMESAAIEPLVTLAARYGCEITGPHPGRPANRVVDVVLPQRSTRGSTTISEESNDND